MSGVVINHVTKSFENENEPSGYKFVLKDVNLSIRQNEFICILGKTDCYHFCTNGSHCAGEAGIMTIGIGLSKESLAHTVNEYIEVQQLTKAIEAYCCVMSALL